MSTPGPGTVGNTIPGGCESAREDESAEILAGATVALGHAGIGIDPLTARSATPGMSPTTVAARNREAAHM